MSAAAIVLSAGASRRMGRPKALLPVPAPGAAGRPAPGDGETFLARVVRSARAAGVAEVVVVVGPPHGAAIRAAAAGLPARFADNPQPERGMLSSAQAGARALSPGVAGALLWPVDIPLVSVETLRRLLAAAPAGRLIVPVHGERGGHPLWVPAALLPALLALPPEAPGGLRLLREAHPPLRLPVDDPAILRDVDTPEDLAVLLPPSSGPRC